MQIFVEIKLDAAYPPAISAKYAAYLAVFSSLLLRKKRKAFSSVQREQS
jgi:hypothetical protein